VQAEIRDGQVDGGRFTGAPVQVDQRIFDLQRRESLWLRPGAGAHSPPPSCVAAVATVPSSRHAARTHKEAARGHGQGGKAGPASLSSGMAIGPAVECGRARRCRSGRATARAQRAAPPRRPGRPVRLLPACSRPGGRAGDSRPSGAVHGRLGGDAQRCLRCCPPGGWPTPCRASCTMEGSVLGRTR